jgi:hypothetical protein
MFPNKIRVRMGFLPSAIQFFMDQVPGAARSFFNQDLSLDQLQLRRFFRNISEEPETIGDVMQPEEFLS